MVGGIQLEREGVQSESSPKLLKIGKMLVIADPWEGNLNE
jgi:hypothetical protein